jgi:hypothetical protein
VLGTQQRWPAWQQHVRQQPRSINGSRVLVRVVKATTYRRDIAGLDSFKPLIAKTRIPWYEWVMNPAAHRVAIPEVLAPVAQANGSALRVFNFTERRTRESSTRMTFALRNQLAGIEAGATALALPSPKAAPLMGDATVRGFTLTAATGSVTGSIPVLSAATDDVAGAYNWAVYTDSQVLGSAVTAALFDSDRNRLVVADATGSIQYRQWQAGSLGSWQYLAPSTVKVPPVLQIIPMVNGYRVITRSTGAIWVYDVSAVGKALVAKFPYVTTDGMWFSTGPSNELYIAFQRANGNNFVLVFNLGVFTGFSVQALSGPVTTDATGKPYVLVRNKLVDNADSLVALDGTGWTTSITGAAALTAFNNP